jgi:hypothetical protein
MAPMTPKPIAHDDAIFRNSALVHCCTFTVRLLAPHQEHLALLREGLQVLYVLVDFAGHVRLNYSENVLSWHLKSRACRRFQ